MLESTPGAPFTGSVKDLVRVEGDMRFRWAALFTFPQADWADDKSFDPTSPSQNFQLP